MGIVIYLSFDTNVNLNIVITSLFFILILLWISINKYKLLIFKIHFGILSNLFLIILGYQLSYYK
ncbi:MAG: hypothetical protein ACK452_01115, partial [Bacteroidota bacterium]